ncbi:MAG: peptidoglycan-binding domain-containing protein [Candidatus Paceibacterota bacterium]|jgi:hypothetical protein
MKKIFFKVAGWSLLALLLLSASFSNVSAKGRAVRDIGSSDCSSVLGYFSDEAPGTLAYTNTHSLSLYAGQSYGSSWDSDSNLTDPGGLLPVSVFGTITVSAVDPLPAGISAFKTKELTYGREITSYAAPGVSSKGPWLRVYAAGTPSSVGETKVRIKANYTYKGTACTEDGYVNFKVKTKPAAYVPPPITSATPSSTNGKIKFIKEGLKANPKDHSSFYITSVAGMKDKMVIGGNCILSPNLWVMKEDGSAILSSRDGCDDSSSGAWSMGHMGGLIASEILINWASDLGSFVHPIRSVDEAAGMACSNPGPSGEPGDCAEYYPGGINYSVYYDIDDAGELSVSSISTLGNGSDFTNVVLKDRLITREGRLLGLPDWNKLGTVGGWDKVEGNVNGENLNNFGFGDFWISAKGETWSAYKVSAGGSRTLLKNLPVKGSAVYTFDNSVWPPRLASWEFTTDSFGGKGPAKVNIFRATTNDIVLDKTINIPEGTKKEVAGPTFRKQARYFAVWGDYVLFVGQVPNGSYKSSGGAIITTYSSSIILWKDGQKIDELALPYSTNDSLNSITVTQGGYLILGMQREQRFLVYKLDLSLAGGANTNPLFNYTPTPPPGSCSAFLTFNTTAIPYGGSVTETWKVVGADLGQTYGDCGAGETQISAEPTTPYTIPNLTKTTTCRVYGKIGGVEACSAQATVTVGAKPAGGFDNSDQPDVAKAAADNASVTADTIVSQNQKTYNLGSRTLRRGSLGPAVEDLQNYLNDTVHATLSVDGKFGPKTEAEVEKWQIGNGLVSDGIVGPKTKEKIQALVY